MDERDWVIIDTLYKHKNITKTAQELFITQPALTGRLQYLERFFGVKIVNRTTKGVQFTAQGEYLAKKSKIVLNDLLKTKNEVKSIADKVMGTIHIAASSYITAYRLPIILKPFKQIYPEIEVKVFTDWSKDIFGHVFNNDAHVGFASVADINTVERHLISQENVCVASVEDFDMSNLPRYLRIDYQANYLLRSRVDKWWRDNYNRAPSNILVIDKLATCIEMIRSGLGYAIVPCGAVKNFPGIKLVPIKDKYDKFIMFETWMIYNKDIVGLKIAKIFIDFVKNNKITD